VNYQSPRRSAARGLNLGGQAVVTLHERKATLRTTNMQKRQISENVAGKDKAA